MKSTMPDRHKIAVSAIIALVIVGAQTPRSWAAASAITAPLASATGLGVFSMLASRKDGSTQKREKQILAAAAIEDATHFYVSGEIRGLLPLILTELREGHQDQAPLSDEELIDSIVEQAEQIIDSAAQLSPVATTNPNQEK